VQSPVTSLVKIGIVILFLTPAFALAQTDTIPPAPLSADSIQVSSSGKSETVVTEKDTAASKHSVKKATLLSAVLPGAGQIYNKKYWKLPIIYGAFAGLGYLIAFNNKEYRNYEDALVARLDDDPNTVDTEYTDKYTDENLRTLSDYYHSNRDLSIVVTVLVYALNIIDAHVDAHMYTFDVSDDLSMRVEPTLVPKTYMGFSGYNPGVSFKLRF
jgi:hypothetical protein